MFISFKEDTHKVSYLKKKERKKEIFTSSESWHFIKINKGTLFSSLKNSSKDILRNESCFTLHFLVNEL